MNSRTINITRIVILFLLLLIPAFYAVFTAIDMEYSWLKKAAYMVVVIALLLLPALVFKAKTYFILEGIFNFFFFPIDIASLYLNRQSTSVPFLENILHTDLHEATELLASIWPLCLTVIALWVLYFFLAARVQNTYLLHRRARIGLLSCFAFVVICGLCVLWRHERRINPSRSYLTTLVDVKDDVLIKFYKIYPYNLYVETSDIIQENRNQRRMQEQLSTFHFGIQPLNLSIMVFK